MEGFLFFAHIKSIFSEIEMDGDSSFLQIVYGFYGLVGVTSIFKCLRESFRMGVFLRSIRWIDQLARISKLLLTHFDAEMTSFMQEVWFSWVKIISVYSSIFVDYNGNTVTSVYFLDGVHNQTTACRFRNADDNPVICGSLTICIVTAVKSSTLIRLILNISSPRSGRAMLGIYLHRSPASGLMEMIS